MSLNAFPAISQSFINSFSGTRKFVDITNGSNTNNGDTEATAYQTLAHAQSQTAAINTAVMYVINPGTYNLTSVEVTSLGCAGFSDSNLPRIFFCAPNGQTVLQWTAGAQRDAAMVSLQNNSSAVYGAVLKRNNNGRTDNYSVAMFNNGTTHCQGDFYNCVFQETNANGNWSLQYDNSASAQSTVNNCTFYTIENGAGDYTGGAGLVFNNCAFNYTYGAGSAVKNNTVINQTIDAVDYELTTDNTIYGAYSGTYAWGALGPSVEYLVVAGGGSGGHAHGGGGGGGGIRAGVSNIIVADLYTVTIGAGGASKTARGQGNKGFNSVFRNISATGGGGGGSQDQTSVGQTGGCGGGGGNATSGTKAGGAGNEGGYSPVEGYAGGSASAGSAWVSAGGGGAGGVGGAASSATPGNGGIGFASSITGQQVYYGGGGGGCGENSGSGGSGGQGGGTNGSGGTSGSASAAANTGGGSGGARDQPGSALTPSGAGGSGVVILKYPSNLTVINSDGGLTFTTVAAGQFKVTTFIEGTGSIQFNANEISVEYLVVAGGGGGGGDEGGGGGGAGGYIASSTVFIFDTPYTLTIGEGGQGGSTDNKGTNGSDSVFSSITAIGGGAGGANGRSNVLDNDGSDGGSGGGTAPRGADGSFNNDVGLGTSEQGNNGGRGYWRSGDYLNGGGGGGAGSVGQDSGSTAGAAAGNGGIGIENSITGAAVYYAGGGGGGGYSNRTIGGSGGLGGGGNGPNYPSIGSASTPGNANTGGGGAGGGEATPSLAGTAGGSGVVILKYPAISTISNTGGSLTFTTVTVSGYKITTFTAGSGSIQFTANGITSSHPTAAYWGETITFTYFDTGQANNSTIAYSITGVTSVQISNAALTGNFTFNNSLATVTVALSTQSSLAIATMVFTAGDNTFTIDISNIVSLTSSVPGTFWGGTIIFTALTKGLTSNGTVSYSISGVTSAQISNAALTANATYVSGSGLDGTATFTVVTRAAEPVLNSATMVTDITGASLTNIIRTGSPRLSESYRSSVSSLVFIDTEISDVHAPALESRVNTLASVSSQVQTSRFVMSPNTLLFVDTDVTDVHAPALEATVFALDNINAQLEVSRLVAGLDGFVAAPTFAYSSGQEIKVAPQVIQTWFI